MTCTLFSKCKKVRLWEHVPNMHFKRSASEQHTQVHKLALLFHFYSNIKSLVFIPWQRRFYRICRIISALLSEASIRSGLCPDSESIFQGIWAECQQLDTNLMPYNKCKRTRFQPLVVAIQEYLEVYEYVEKKSRYFSKYFCSKIYSEWQFCIIWVSIFAICCI